MICLGLVTSSARAAHTQAQLILASDSAKPGDTVLVGIHLKMEPGWHTYWKNSGAAGMPTKIEWQLPPGVTAGEIEWPLPVKLPPPEVITYGYEGETVLLVPIKLGTDLKPGPLNLKAKVSWLECKEQCIPAGATVQATLNIGDEAKPSSDLELINSWKSKLPNTGRDFFSYKIHWEKSVDDDTRTVIIEGVPTKPDVLPIEKVDFFPDANDQYEVQGQTEKIESKNGFALRKAIKKYSGDWPTKLSGVIIIEDKQRWGGELNEPITGTIAAATVLPNPDTSVTAVPSAATQSLGQMLLYAFIGGLILNVMPCVLPVIALKILGFVGEARNEPGRVRALGLVYTLGVVVSFLALAAIVIGVKAAGHQAGWGMQFGDPRFLIALTILVVLVALNLFGVFEVTLGGRTMGAAGQLASKARFCRRVF